MLEDLFGDNHESQDSSINLNLFEVVDDEEMTRVDCTAELRKYATITNASTANARNPLRWWKRHYLKFPLLAPVARKWLGCLCSSVPSERAFSTSGNTVTVRRARLGDELVRDIVFLHDNCSNLEN
jgi:hypothetical protein